MTTLDALAARYDDVARFEETVELTAREWDEASDRDDLARWGVGAAVRDGERILLVRHDDRWMLPGGMLEPDESHAEGAAREVREETGIPVDVTDLGAIVEQRFVNTATGEEFPFAFAAFLADPRHTDVTDDPGLDGESIDAVAWHDTLPENTFQREMVATLFSA